MRYPRTASVLTIAALAMLGTPAQSQSQRSAPAKEVSQRVPMPAGFQVIQTDEDGPVFATAEGRTVYRWPFIQLRNGDAGDQKGKPTCTDTLYKENAGLMSPYPGGFIMPDADTRLSCVQLWPPVWAPDGAQNVGKWTAVKHPNGKSQWAYDGDPLYTSMLDKKPGDVNGGTARRSVRGSASGALREPVGPPALLPPGFIVLTVATGRLLATSDRASVYVWDRDAPNKSNCLDRCTEEWAPVLAPEFAEGSGEWGVITRSPGVKQWTFRARPLYTYVQTGEGRRTSLAGSDVAGWHNAYTQRAPFPSKEFTIQDGPAGQVLADRTGKTIYVYNCNDDAWDQQACNHPDLTQAYRLAICGAGSQEKCMSTFPYVLAGRDAKSENAAWSVMEIDPKTGHRARPGEGKSLRVWAYRDRPVYTFHLDREPGDIKGDSWGEFQGQRNGFKAIFLRDDYFDNAS